MTDQEVKRAVRERDGYKCVCCGMDNNLSLTKYGKCLDVHRLLPGSVYRMEGCITVCRDCHNTFPRTLEGAVFGKPTDTGFSYVYWNVYDDKDYRILSTLEAKAEELGITWVNLLDRILHDYCDSVAINYVI